jgi:thiamine biosynthesis protein ThiS
MAMKLIVNGAERSLEAASVAALLAELELRPEVVAVELNGALVPRAEHGATTLAEGDRVEIVTLVGGG